MKVSKEVCREEHEVKNCQNGKESLTDSAGKDDGRYQALDKTLDQLFWEEDDL